MPRVRTKLDVGAVSNHGRSLTTFSPHVIEVRTPPTFAAAAICPADMKEMSDRLFYSPKPNLSL